MGKETEKGQFGVETQVEHAFGMVEAQTSALASAHDANTDFSFGNRFEADRVELICNFDKLGSGADIFHGGEFKLLIGIIEFGVEKDVFEELIGLLKVDAFELLQEIFFQLGVNERLIVFNKVMLIVEFGLVKDVIFH